VGSLPIWGRPISSSIFVCVVGGGWGVGGWGGDIGAKKSIWSIAGAKKDLSSSI
jgi:hypothetical protein